MGTNKQNTQGHKKEEQRSFLILGLFLRKKLAKKDMMCDTSVPMTLQIELSNEQEQTQLFFCQMEKSSEWFHLIRQLFHEFFQQLFQLDKVFWKKTTQRVIFLLLSLLRIFLNPIL